MKNNVTPLVEGGLLVAISVVLGLSATYLPVIGIAVEFFCAVPFVILTVRQDIHRGIMALIVSFFLLSMFMGPLLAGRITLTINICGVVLGWCIQKNFTTLKCFLSTFTVAIIAQIVTIVFIMLALGMDITESELSVVKESFEQSFQMYESIGVDAASIAEMKNQVEPVLKLMKVLMPTIIILVALVNTVTCYITAKWIFQKLKFKFAEPLLQFKYWKFPIFFLYLAAFSIIGMYWGYSRAWNLVYLISVNSMVFSMLIGLLQGLAVLSFAADKYNISTLARRLAFAVIILNMLFLQIVAFIGLFDMIFDYRKKLLS